MVESNCEFVMANKKCGNATGFRVAADLNMNSSFTFTLSPASFSQKKSCFISPRVSFSPESGGRVNPRRAMEEMSTQGTIRLKK